MTEVIKKIGYNKGSDNSAWRGGRHLVNGYWVIWNPDHPFCGKDGYIYEHRLVMEEYLDRYLTTKEEVHHLDMNKQNNRIGNLMLFATKTEHLRYELMGNTYGKKDMGGRICLICDSTITYILKRNNTPLWYHYQDGFICNKCYMKIINKHQ